MKVRQKEGAVLSQQFDKHLSSCSVQRDCVQSRDVVFSLERLCSVQRDCVQSRDIVFSLETLCSVQRDCVQSREIVFSLETLCSVQRHCVQSREIELMKRSHIETTIMESFSGLPAYSNCTFSVNAWPSQGGFVSAWTNYTHLTSEQGSVNRT